MRTFVTLGEAKGSSDLKLCSLQFVSYEVNSMECLILIEQGISLTLLALVRRFPP